MKYLNKKYSVNSDIRADKVRIINNEEENGVYDLKTATELAKKQNANLIAVNERVYPPICVIADNGKFMYSQKKEKKDSFINPKWQYTFLKRQLIHRIIYVFYRLSS